MFSLSHNAYKELGIRTIPLEGKKAKVRWKDVTLDTDFTGHDGNVGMICGDVVTIVDVDDASLLDEARSWFGYSPLESKTPKGHHLWYRSNGEPRMIRPLGKDIGIDILGINGYAVVPASEGYSFVRGALEEVPNLPPLNIDALKQSPMSSAMVPGSLVDGLSQMGEGSGRNTSLFKMALALTRGATSKESLLSEVEAANRLFAEPLPLSEVQAVTNSTWGYRENGTLLVKGQPSTLIRKDAHAKLYGNSDAIALFTDLMHNHAGRNGKEFVLANVTRERLGLSQARFVKAVNYLAKTGLLQVTKSGGKGPGSVRTVRLLAT